MLLLLRGSARELANSRALDSARATRHACCQKPGLNGTGAWPRVAFMIRNADTSYFLKTNPNTLADEQGGGKLCMGL